MISDLKFRKAVAVGFRTWLLVVALIVLPTSAAEVDRPADPVVLTGADIPSLAGIPPSDLVAFRHDGTWQQIPVQVDERAVINFTDVYDGRAAWGSLTRLDYTDAGTFTGPDADPAIDADDEVVFMAADAGQRCASFSEPPGVIANSGIQVIVTDPLAGASGYVYLFQQDGSLDPAAGQEYVNYSFDLLSGDYKTTYSLSAGPNPEDSYITTPFYQRHFSDRWVCDGLQIFAGAATGVDILDRHKNLFAPGVCGRSEDTFSLGEGAFIVNKSGPVRAIRSYVGCNSGPRTQRQHVYYELREDITTFLRVHEIGGIVNFFDYSPAASGMVYYCDVDTTGVLIDGVPDSVSQGPISWEMVEGAQGSLAVMLDLITDIPDPSYTSYYLDSTTPPDTQCTGDAFSYGASGFWMNHGIPNTDPVASPSYSYIASQVLYYAAPGLTVAGAQGCRTFVDRPLVTWFALWDGAVDSDGDGVPDVTDAFPQNPGETEDVDGDGLGDNFEHVIIDFDPGDSINALADVLPGDDFDGDTATNLTEFIDGTDPTSAAMRLSALRASGVICCALALAFGACRALRPSMHPPGARD